MSNTLTITYSNNIHGLVAKRGICQIETMPGYECAELTASEHVGYDLVERRFCMMNLIEREAFNDENWAEYVAPRRELRRTVLVVNSAITRAERRGTNEQPILVRL